MGTANKPKCPTHDSTDPVSGAVVPCSEFYLVNDAQDPAQTGNMGALPNRRFRIIDPVKGKTILGRSDAQGYLLDKDNKRLKKSKLFKEFLVEILPETGRTFLDGRIAGTFELIQKNEALTTNKISDKKKIITADNIDTEISYIQKLESDHPYPGLQSQYNTILSDPVTVTTTAPAPSGIGTINVNVNVGNFIIDRVPIVPNGGKLALPVKLFKNFQKGQASNINEYSVINFLEGSHVGCTLNAAGHHLGSGSDHRLNDILARNLNSGIFPTQYLYVAGHADENEFAIYDPTFSTTRHMIIVDENIFMARIRSHANYNADVPIVFFACNFGRGVNSMAERLSRLLNVGTVYAGTDYQWDTTDKIWFGPIEVRANITVIPLPSPILSDNSSKYDRDPILDNIYGHFRVFNGAKFAHRT